MSFVISAAAFSFAAAICGWAVDKVEHTTEGDTIYICVAILSMIGVVVSFVRLLQSCDISFGSPDVPSGFVCVGMLIGCAAAPLLALLDPNNVGIRAADLSIVLVTPLLLVAMLNLRGLMLLPFCLIAFTTCVPIHPYLNSIGNLGFAVSLSISMFVPYVWDQRMLCLLGCLFSSAFGCVAMRDVPGGIGLVILVYLVELFNRRRRRLPPALQGCLFVRMGYLRKMKAAGSLIRRCQELPPEAFGHVSKASVLLTTSHRWLHRYTCDVVDKMHPCGVRLTSMLRRIALTYPENVAGLVGNGFRSCISRLINGLLTGGSDVVFFFDFMGLPQIGQLPDGSLIQRTEAETSLFVTALPAMGAMYSMYQVLVIPEVTGDVHPYFSSGWCFSEFCTAMLCQKLEQFSAESIDEHVQWLADTARAAGNHALALQPQLLQQLSSGTLTAQDVADFSVVFEADLSNKKLFNEGDRLIILGIVKGYLLLRLLVDAVRNQKEADVQSLLIKLAEQELESSLHNPVDESLDTLLHIAARLPSIQITLALLQAGADPNARNLSGDTPTQFYMCPRLRAGASLCREWQGTPDNYRPVGA